MFTIKEVSDITGVNSVTLRAWQRRYGLLNPARTEKGHRLYSQADIEKIQSILGWLEKGVAIGKVRPLLETASLSVIEDASIETENDIRKAVEQLLDALANVNARTLDKQLTQLMKEYPLDVFDKQIAARVNGVINSSDNPLSAIQTSLWRNVLSERCLFQVVKSRRRNNKPCVLISFDVIPSYRVWLQMMTLTEIGYSVTLLTNLSGKLSPLIVMMKELQVKTLYIDGDNKLSRYDQEQLIHLIYEVECIVYCTGSINSIHPHLSEGKYK
ncbi:MerR family transcriptional regulator [Photobacterium minamisatsumaniensis]|uniref:MerR family transcriptional regulator n=1 Tax=Photobacterium minamisatsumaniensis TaxID=2910233 RepID=UPI003D0CBE1F